MMREETSVPAEKMERDLKTIEVAEGLVVVTGVKMMQKEVASEEEVDLMMEDQGEEVEIFFPKKISHL